MRKTILTLSSLLVISTLVNAQNSDTETIEIDKNQILVETVLSEDEQAALSPNDVFESLRAGNVRFVSNSLTARDHSAQIRESAMAQYPKAIVLSCVDSRVPVEDIFDKGIGDIFVTRVAGNFINDDILGSMEMES